MNAAPRVCAAEQYGGGEDVSVVINVLENAYMLMDD